MLPTPYYVIFPTISATEEADIIIIVGTIDTIGTIVTINTISTIGATEAATRLDEKKRVRLMSHPLSYFKVYSRLFHKHLLSVDYVNARIKSLKISLVAITFDNHTVNAVDVEVSIFADSFN